MEICGAEHFDAPTEPSRAPCFSSHEKNLFENNCSHFEHGKEVKGFSKHR
jgi:hypothetical protein